MDDGVFDGLVALGGKMDEIQAGVDDLKQILADDDEEEEAKRKKQQQLKQQAQATGGAQSASASSTAVGASADPWSPEVLMRHDGKLLFTFCQLSFSCFDQYLRCLTLI